jgi:SAM-dependent methyltransferase
LKPEFDQHARDYDRVLEQALPPGMAEDRYFAEYKVALMARLLRGRTPARILDFGCGAGRSLTCLEEYFPGSRIWGYDISGESLKVAATRTRSSTLVSDWNELEGLKFDAIFTANVFHHIPPAQRVAELTRCREHLAEGGKVFLFEHNPYNPLTRWVFERCEFDRDAEMLSLRSALEMARESGLPSCERGYTLFFPKPLASLRGLEPMLRKLPLGAQYYVQMAH